MDFLRPPADNPRARTQWEVAVSICIAITGLAATCAIFGPYKVAMAGDVETKINAAKLDLAQQIQQVAAENKRANEATNAKLDTLARLQAESLAQNTATQIRLQISKRCKTVGFIERDEITREIDRLQGVYLSFAGRAYREPSCADL